jgi:hypothetical protein
MSVFSHVKVKKPKSSTFDLSHQKKLSGKMGELIPIFCAETVPGDEFKINTAQLLRMAPMLAPIFHQITVYQHFFFVPNRLLWDNWEGFITGGEDGNNSSVWPNVEFSSSSAIVGNLSDYMGIPDSFGYTAKVSALPFAAYGTIYNEYYRDENLITKKDFKCVDGTQATTSDLTLLSRGTCLKRAWQHDYFTSALPWTQKGPEATIPLGTTAPITFANNQADSVFAAGSAGWTSGNYYDLEVEANTYQSGILRTDIGGGVRRQTTIDNSANLTTDLSAATAATINDLRSAFRLQEWLEKNARGGSRYIESILSHFGVRSSDARLQRPEFLGGGSVPIQVSEVLQTTPAVGSSTPLAEMAGHGIAVGSNSNIEYRCEEHGFIMGIMSIMPKTAYQDGLNKMWNREDRFDYFWPEFAHLGEQEIALKELYTNTTTPDAVFGYTPRYAEYKYMNDTVHGELKTTLDFWHLGRKFATVPSLNQTFIECEPSDRIFAVQGQEHIYAIINHKVLAKRPMPYFGTPTF